MRLWLRLWPWLLLLVLVCAIVCRPHPRPLGYDRVAEHWRLIRDEALAVPDSDVPMKRERTDWDVNLDSFVAQLGENNAWIEAWADDGSWDNYPLMIEDKVVDGKASELCPNTCKLLSSLSGVKIAGFSKVKAKGRIQPHTDSGVGLEHGRLALHLGLSGESLLTVGNRVFKQSPGRTIVFNQEEMHSVENTGNEDRTLLYINFMLP